MNGLDGYQVCDRIIRHWWRELEPGVRRCLLCRCLEFDNATQEQLRRWLVLSGERQA